MIPAELDLFRAMEIAKELIGFDYFTPLYLVFFLYALGYILKAFISAAEMTPMDCAADGDEVQIGVKNKPYQEAEESKEPEQEPEQPQDERDCRYCQTIQDDDWKKPYCSRCGAPL
jgi:hypothetical protein